MSGAQERPKPKVEKKRIRVRPIGIANAPGETDAQTVKAIIDLDNFLTDAIASGKMKEVRGSDGSIHVVKVE